MLEIILILEFTAIHSQKRLADPVIHLILKVHFTLEGWIGMLAFIWGQPDKQEWFILNPVHHLFIRFPRDTVHYSALWIYIAGLTIILSPPHLKGIPPDTFVVVTGRCCHLLMPFLASTCVKCFPGNLTFTQAGAFICISIVKSWGKVNAVLWFLW